MNVQQKSPDEITVSWVNPRGDMQYKGLALIAGILALVWMPVVSAISSWPSFIAVVAILFFLPCGTITVLLLTLSLRCVFGDRREQLRFSPNQLVYRQAGAQGLFFLGHERASDPCVKQQLAPFVGSFTGFVSWALDSPKEHVVVLNQLPANWNAEDNCCVSDTDGRPFCIGVLLEADDRNAIKVALTLWESGETIVRIEKELENDN